MQTLKAIDPNTATGKTKELFDAIQQRMKKVPNMIQVMGNAPAILDTYLHFNLAFGQTKMAPRLRGIITAAIAEINGCDYTLSIAYALASHEGVSVEELNAARRGEASDAKTAVALQFAIKALRQQGHVSSEEVSLVRGAGYTDEEIVEIIGLIALNLFRNYFNLIAGTEVDYPLVKTNQEVKQAAV